MDQGGLEARNGFRNLWRGGGEQGAYRIGGMWGGGCTVLVMGLEWVGGVEGSRGVGILVLKRRGVWVWVLDAAGLA